MPSGIIGKKKPVCTEKGNRGSRGHNVFGQVIL